MGFVRSRERAKELIQEGKCLINGKPILKSAYNFDEEGDRLEFLEHDFVFVGRAALKLEAALDEFSLDVKGKVIVDVGVATGGFSDSLLRRGAHKVFGVDVGKGQLKAEIAENPKFVFVNKDVRLLESQDFPDGVDMVVVDVSFISLRMVFPSLVRLFGYQKEIDYIFLIKPQFELGKKHSGVIKDPKELQRVLRELEDYFQGNGAQIIQTMASPIRGKEGNQEYLWYLHYDPDNKTVGNH
jgi:23S rRNA (cytidine1920-2'-O)/16S rRNA (cytidine1409-2'-O)-methyltransferase